MSNEKPGTLERVGTAMQSDDLGMREERVGDVDRLIAYAVSTRGRKIAAVLRLAMTHDRHAAGEAIAEVRVITRDVLQRQRFPITPRKVNAVAHRVLRLYMSPACPACHGRGHVGMAKAGGMRGSPRLCQACGGTRVAPVEGQFAAEVRAVLAKLQSWTHEVEWEVGYRMRRAA